MPRGGEGASELAKGKIGPGLALGCLLVPPLLLLLWWSVMLIVDAEVPKQVIGGYVCLAISLLFVLASGLMVFRVHRGAQSTEPEVVLRGFYSAVARKAFKQAASYVLSGDFDEAPRQMPALANLGVARPTPFLFGRDGDFAAYWRALLHHKDPIPYCLASVSKVKVHPVAPDIVAVDFHLRLHMNTSIYWFFLPIGILIPALIDIATRTHADGQLQRILVRVGDKWRLLSGDWQAEEERELDWIPAHEDA